MVAVARQLITKLRRDDFCILHCKIEDVMDTQFTSAVSIHSYYAWPEPEAVLRHIHDLIIPGGMFVLATPNENLDMPKLLSNASRELIAHPDYEEFVHYNLQLVENPNAKFTPLDTLVKQAHNVGFKIHECHQRHYLGGVNFLLLEKA